MEWGLLSAWIPYLAAALLMVALAAWLLVLDIGSRTHRVFAALLVARGVTMGLSAARGMASSVAEEAYLLGLLPYFQIPVAVLALYFVFLYPNSRGWIGRSGAAGWVVIAGIAAAELAYAWDHRLFYTLAERDGPVASFLLAGPRLAYADFGPLFLLGAQPLAFGIVALLLAVGWSRRRAEHGGYSGFLVYAGFALNALFDGTIQAIAVGRLLAEGAPFPWLPWGWSATLGALTLFPALASLVVVAGHARALPRGDARRRHALRLVVLSPLPVLSALALGLLGPLTAVLTGPLAAFVLGVWRLALPVLVTYALVRHQLFDIDVKVKAGLRASTVAAAFLAVFFTVSELASNIIQETVGTALGVVAAVGLAFALRPVERLAETMAHRIMPGTRPIETMMLSERELFYREQVELALQDGTMGAKERAMLDRLRTRLGLSPEEVSRAEHAVQGEASAA